MFKFIYQLSDLKIINTPKLCKHYKKKNFFNSLPEVDKQHQLQWARFYPQMNPVCRTSAKCKMASEGTKFAKRYGYTSCLCHVTIMKILDKLDSCVVSF